MFCKFTSMNNFQKQAGAELSQAQVSYTLKSLVGSLAVLFSNGLKLLFVDQMKLNKWSWPKQDVPVQLIRLSQIKSIEIKLIKSLWKQLSLAN